MEVGPILASLDTSAKTAFKYGNLQTIKTIVKKNILILMDFKYFYYYEDNYSQILFLEYLLNSATIFKFLYFDLIFSLANKKDL